MKRRTADLFSEFEHIHERMEQAYRRVIGAPGSPSFVAPILEPAVDVYETDADVIVVVEMAGIADEEIELEVDGVSLTVRGHRRPVREGPRRAYSQMEISHGTFERIIRLPSEVNADSAQALYRSGMLEIVLPKTAAPAGRQLRIVVH